MKQIGTNSKHEEILVDVDEDSIETYETQSQK